MKILLVDDSNSICMVVGQMLKDAGYEYDRAENGKIAVELITKNATYDVILLDWNMPEMDGLQFLEHIQAHKLTHAPVIMMTTENKPEKILKALQAGAVEYIMKPFTQDIIISKIETVLKKAA